MNRKATNHHFDPNTTIVLCSSQKSYQEYEMKVLVILSLAAIAAVTGQRPNYPSKQANYAQPPSYPRPAYKPEGYKQASESYARPVYKPVESYKPDYETPVYEVKPSYSPKPAVYPVSKPAYPLPEAYEPKYSKPAYPAENYASKPAVYEPKYNAKPQYAGGYGQNYETGMPFSFAWAVKDDYYYNDYAHASESDGKVTKGEYRTLLPDGRTQVVTYVADDYNGYNADVKYLGEAKPYEYKPSNYEQKSYSPKPGNKPDYHAQEPSYQSKPSYDDVPSPAYRPKPTYPANQAYPKPSYKPVENYQPRPSYPPKYPSNDKY